MVLTFVITPSIFALDGEGNDGEYFISGISTREDIGGVEISRTVYGSSNYYYLVFENYNNFIVTIIFEYTPSGTGEKHTGTIVLRANEKKQTPNYYFNPISFKMIVRKLST